MENIKVVRLHSGEDIIAEVLEDDEMVILNHPMILIVKRNIQGTAVMYLMPWLPSEVLKENSATLYRADILTTLEPKDDMSEYYVNTVKAVNERSQLKVDLMEEIKKFTDEYVEEESEESEESEEDEEYYTSILNGTKLGTVH